MARAGLLLALGALLLAGTAGAQPAAAPGTRFELRPEQMPAPHATRSAGNLAGIVPRPAGAAPILPPGFRAELVAEGLTHARWLTVAANGDILLAETAAGFVTLLRDTDGDGRADYDKPFALGHEMPHGLVIQGNWLYVADLYGVWRYPYRPGQLKGEGKERVTPRGALGEPVGHWTRTLLMDPGGRGFHVAIGSQANVAEEDAPHASVVWFDADGSGRRTIASGLRNPVGLARHPTTGDIYAVVNERDGYGDGLVPDYLTRIREGEFYGWPYAYIGANPDPTFGARRPDRVAATRVPDLLFLSHSAPLGLVFYDGGQFPAEYRGDAFVALHGSWNATEPAGYAIVRVPFAEGRPRGGYEIFATGFTVEGGTGLQVWGRPVGLAVGPDGCLYFADDAGNTVWRIRYTGR